MNITLGLVGVEPMPDDRLAVVAQNNNANDGCIICEFYGPDREANAKFVADAFNNRPRK